MIPATRRLQPARINSDFILAANQAKEAGVQLVGNAILRTKGRFGVPCEAIPLLQLCLPNRNS
jgi:hypothetical protein